MCVGGVHCLNDESRPLKKINKNAELQNNHVVEF